MDTNIHAAAGEYLVLGELLRRGFECYPAHINQIGWDILYLKEKSVRREIQVKTIDWPNQKAVNINKAINFDVLIVVLLDRDKENCIFYVIPKKDVLFLMSPENEQRNDSKRTITFSNDFLKKYNKKYMGKWENIN